MWISVLLGWILLCIVMVYVAWERISGNISGYVFVMSCLIVYLVSIVLSSETRRLKK